MFEAIYRLTHSVRLPRVSLYSVDSFAQFRCSFFESNTDDLEAIQSMTKWYEKCTKGVPYVVLLNDHLLSGNNI